jgi:hypothetical protein
MFPAKNLHRPDRRRRLRCRRHLDVGRDAVDGQRARLSERTWLTLAHAVGVSDLSAMAAVRVVVRLRSVRARDLRAGRRYCRGLH